MTAISMLINGERVQATGGATFERRNPLDGSVATTAPAASVTDAKAAADAAAKAFPAWSALGPNARRALLLNEHTASLDAPLEIDNGHTVGETIVDENAINPEHSLQADEVAHLITHWVKALPDKHRRVLEHRYGLGGAEICTLEEVAADLGLTRERVRQIQIEALDQLRRSIRRGGIAQDSLL